MRLPIRLPTNSIPHRILTISSVGSSLHCIHRASIHFYRSFSPIISTVFSYLGFCTCSCESHSNCVQMERFYSGKAADMVVADKHSLESKVTAIKASGPSKLQVSGILMWICSLKIIFLCENSELGLWVFNVIWVSVALCLLLHIWRNSNLTL